MTQIIMASMPEPIPTRYSLLSRLQDLDDHESWKDFFDTYWRLIYSVSLKAGLTEMEAQDVVQETVITVSRNIQNFKRDPKHGSFKGWLRNIIRWRIADQLRRRDKLVRSVEFSLEAIPEPSEPTVDEMWERQWQANLLESAISRVKLKVQEEHFQVFDLYAVKNWPARKVARMLGVSVARVYVTKHRISGLIKKELKLLKEKEF
jgi:RNA polymerase sigma-70 factor (ECF subfamily)